MRVLFGLPVLLTIGGCASRLNGRDGMDGYGVSVGLRHELNRDRP